MSSKPWVVEMITRLENGGAQRHALHLCRELPRDRFRVALIYGPGDHLDAAAEEIPELDRFALSDLGRPIHPLRDLRAWQRVRQWLRDKAGGAPIILHTHSSKAGIIGRLAGSGLPGIKRVHTIHGFGYRAGRTWASRRVLRGVEQLGARFCDWSLCVSEYDRQIGATLGLLKRAHSSVIYPGVELARFAQPNTRRGTFREALGIPVDAPVIGSIGCLKPQKAPLDVLRCAAIAKQSLPELHLIYIGDGQLRGAFLAEAEKLGLGDALHFLGWSDHVPQALAAMDVFVLLSLWEGLPRVLLEARATGLPAVVSDICGNPEAIEKAGVMVSPHQPGLAAQKIVEILTTPVLFKQLAVATQENLERFDAKYIIPKHLEIFENLIEGSV